MSKDVRRKVWSLMWRDLRWDYLFIAFAIALATASVVDDFLPLLIGGDGMGTAFRYILAVVVTAIHAIAKMIWGERAMQKPGADPAE